MPTSTSFTSPAGGPVMGPRPGTSIVALFDGQCGVCTRSAAWIGARDPAGRVERLDLRDPATQERFPSFSPDAVRAQLHAIDADGQVTVGLDGVIAVLRELPRWRAPVSLLRIPGIHGLAAVAYRWFARNRLRFNRLVPAPTGAPTCDDGACEVDWDALARAESERDRTAV